MGGGAAGLAIGRLGGLVGAGGAPQALPITIVTSIH